MPENATDNGVITICIPTYRRPSLLAHALQSCIAQSYRPIEIDVGDDSPTDDTQRLVAAITLPPGIVIRYHRNRPGLGQSGNVERLFANARGERLVLLHDDDALLPGALEALDAAWNLAPDVIAAYGMQEVVSENGEVSRADTDHHNGHANRTSLYSGIRRDLLVCAFWRQVPNNAYLVASSAARAIGYRSFAEVGDACDIDFSIRLARHGRGKAFAFIDRMTSQYRMSWTGLNQSDNTSWKFYDVIGVIDALTADEARARDSLLTKIAPEAAFENALQGRRWAALRIIFSRFYRGQSLLKAAYHLGVVAAPRLSALRRLAPRTRFTPPAPQT